MDPILEITDDERHSGCIGQEKVARSEVLLEDYGYLIVRNVISAGSLEELRSFMDAEWSNFQRSKDKWMGGGRLIGHLQMLPPSQPKYFMKDVLLNDIIFQITSNPLGQDVRNVQYAGNTNLPGSVFQHFHPDGGLDFKRSLIINIPLDTVDERNGSLEVIPKSHEAEHSFRDIEALQKQGRAIRVNTHIGDSIIRYPTLLHRGTPNTSASARHMLSMWHAPKGSKVETNTRPFPLDRECREKMGDGFGRLKCCFEDRHAPSFNPNYFAPNMLGLVKEMMFVYTPSLFSLAKRLKG